MGPTPTGKVFRLYYSIQSLSLCCVTGQIKLSPPSSMLVVPYDNDDVDATHMVLGLAMINTMINDYVATVKMDRRSDASRILRRVSVRRTFDND